MADIMLSKLKSALYFPIASYFRFFAKIRLRRWNPRIVVITGSNGKTTLLHLLESQIGDKAHYSHHANSAFGIPFNILNLHRNTYKSLEWIWLLLKAPFQTLLPIPKEKIYIVEADCDRPMEGHFLADLLRPEIVLWISTARTHSMNFDHLVSNGKFDSVEEAIAYEYGYFLEFCKKNVVINGDLQLEVAQLSRTTANVISFKKSANLEHYYVAHEGTRFRIGGKDYFFKSLLPEELFYAIVMCKQAVTYLDMPFDHEFNSFVLPPGRGSLLPGIKDTILIDSTYNANLSSIKALLKMYSAFKVEKKWVVLGDMKELGKQEQKEHESLADLLNSMELERVILIGKLLIRYTLPKLKTDIKVVTFLATKEALSYFEKHLSGGETILFKGSQSLYLEGLIKPLLKNKIDIKKLPRQSPFWNTLREKEGI